MKAQWRGATATVLLKAVTSHRVQTLAAVLKICTKLPPKLANTRAVGLRDRFAHVQAIQALVALAEARKTCSLELVRAMMEQHVFNTCVSSQDP